MPSKTSPPRPSVTTEQGTILGTVITQDIPRPIEAFRGIPYAQPPIGDLRFRAPVPVEKDPNASIDASDFGPVAPGKQLFPGGPAFVYSEDCLTANVFRPIVDGESIETGRLSNASLMPVAVYIHGGAFNRGSSSMHNTASFLSHSGQQFVAVSFNYRIGALGFLPSGMSKEEGALNLGLKDQLLLLEWVRDNIASFGGDPDNVTLFGISAGGHSVSLHLHPQSHMMLHTNKRTILDPQIGHILMHSEATTSQKPLFHKVILESGAPTSRAVRPYNAPIHEQQFTDFLHACSCPMNLSPSETFAFLRKLPSSVVQAAQISVFDKYNPSLRWAFQPVIDGDIIPRTPMESWRLGKWRKVPIMTGFNRNEGSIYVSKKVAKSSDFRKFFADLLPLLDSTDLDTIEKLYPDPLTVKDSPYNEQLEGTGSQYRRLEVAYGQYAYVAPVRQTAELASSTSSNDQPVYLYQWGLESSKLDLARHGENMYYETCDPSRTKISPSLKELCLTLNAYIVSFIMTGDPNGVRGKEGVWKNRPQWEKYDKSEPKAMVFGTENKELVGGEAGVPAVLLKDEWARKESEFWWSKVDVSQQ